MKIMFLTLSPISSNPGHLARFSMELNDLAKSNEISVVCFGEESDNDFTKNKYRNVKFFHHPIIFNGWEVKNLSETVETIDVLVKKDEPDLVVLQMEVWDLMRELGKSLKKKTKFVTIVHAMPFLVSPINPSGKFEHDVIEYINTNIDQYKKDYIIKHYKEVYSVFKDVCIIANNKTVAFYFKTYFKDLKIYKLDQFITANLNKDANIIFDKIKYDFVYMARMEKGKGIEYLPEILKRISLILSKPIKVAVLGRADDVFSKKALHNILQDSKKNKYFDIDYFGWANEICKKKLLPKSGVFLYPSHYDNYPTVLGEALTFGLPCVVWDVPFYRINYSDTEAVQSAPILDFEKFASMAVKMLLNKNYLKEHALNFVNSFYTISQITELDLAVFKNILSSNATNK